MNKGAGDLTQSYPGLQSILSLGKWRVSSCSLATERNVLFTFERLVILLTEIRGLDISGHVIFALQGEGLVGVKLYEQHRPGVEPGHAGGLVVQPPVGKRTYEVTDGLPAMQ